MPAQSTLQTSPSTWTTPSPAPSSPDRRRPRPAQAHPRTRPPRPQRNPTFARGSGVCSVGGRPLRHRPRSTGPNSISSRRQRPSRRHPRSTPRPRPAGHARRRQAEVRPLILHRSEQPLRPSTTTARCSPLRPSACGRLPFGRFPGMGSLRNRRRARSSSRHLSRRPFRAGATHHRRLLLLWSRRLLQVTPGCTSSRTRRRCRRSSLPL